MPDATPQNKRLLNRVLKEQSVDGTNIIANVRILKVGDKKNGVYGEFSKVTEEMSEVVEAYGKGDYLHLINEMSDLIGAMDAYLVREFKGKINVVNLLNDAHRKQRRTDRFKQETPKTVPVELSHYQEHY